MNNETRILFSSFVEQVIENINNLNDKLLFQYCSNFLEANASIFFKLESNSIDLFVYDYILPKTHSGHLLPIKNIDINPAIAEILKKHKIYSFKTLSEIFDANINCKKIDNYLNVKQVIVFTFILFNKIINSFFFLYNSPKSYSDELLELIHNFINQYFIFSHSQKQLDHLEKYFKFKQKFPEYNQIPIAILRESKFIKCNKSFLILYDTNNYSKVINKSLSELSPLLQYDQKASIELEKEIFDQLQTQDSLMFKWNFLTTNKEIINTSCFIQKIESNKIKLYLLFVSEIIHFQILEQQLDYIKNKLFSIYNSIPAAIGILQNRYIVEVNDYFSNLSGYTRQEIIGQNTRIFYANEQDYDNVGKEMYSQAISQGAVYFDLPLRCKNGQIKWFKFSLAPLFKHAPEKGFVATGIDITDHVNTQNNLKLLLSKIEQIYNSIPIGILEVKNQIITEANTYLCQMLKYEKHELIGQKTRKLYLSNRDYLNAGNFIYGQLKKQNFCSYQTCFVTKTGEKIDILLCVSRAQNQYDQNTFIVTVQNISQIKQIENELKKIQNQQELIITNIHDVVWHIDLQMRFLYITPSVFILTGYQPDELIGKSLEMLFLEDEWNRLQQLIKQIASAKKNISAKKFITETTLLTKFKTIKHIEVVTGTLHNENQQIIGIIGVARDITDKKQQEIYQKNITKLQNEVAKLVIETSSIKILSHLLNRGFKTLLTLLDNMMVICYEYKEETSHLQYLCHSTDNTKNRSITFYKDIPIFITQNIIHEIKDKKVFQLNLQNYNFKKIFSLNDEYSVNQVICSSIFVGEYIKGIAFIIPDQIINVSNIKYIELACEQISQVLTKCCMEIKIEQNEKTLRNFLDYSNTYAYVKNIDHKFIYTNTKLKELFPYVDLYLKTEFFVFPRNIAMTIRKNERLAIVNNNQTDTTIKLNQKTFLLRNFPLPLFDGQTSIGGVMIDITEEHYKKHENEILSFLEQSKLNPISLAKILKICYKYLNVYYNINALAFWLYNHLTDSMELIHLFNSLKDTPIRFSHKITNLSQLNKTLSNTYIPKISFTNIENLISSDLFKNILSKKSYSNIKQKHKSNLQTCNIIIKSQDKIYGLISFVLPKLEAEQENRLLIFANHLRSILEKKIAENAIIQSEKINNAILKQIHEMLFILSTDGNILFANNKAINFFKLKSTDLSKTNILDILPSNVKNSFNNHLKKIIKPKTSSNFELVLTDSNNKLHSFIIKITYLNYDKKPATLVTFYDTTKQKLTYEKLFETSLMAQENERERIANELHDGLSGNLASVKMLLSVIKSKAPKKLQSIIHNAQEIINQSNYSLKEIIRNITPRLIQDYGFIRAIESFLDNYKFLGIKTQISHNIKTRFDKHIEINIYRILQELINNGIQHGKCTEIYLKCFLEKQKIIITLLHNGVEFNFDKELTNSKGFGLKNITNRIHYLKGSIKNKNTEKGGMLFEIEIPLR